MTWVAPSFSSSSKLEGEDVAIIGENPESLASWITVFQINKKSVEFLLLDFGADLAVQQSKTRR
jgi:hypothetical protein